MDQAPFTKPVESFVDARLATMTQEERDDAYHLAAHYNKTDGDSWPEATARAVDKVYARREQPKIEHVTISSPDELKDIADDTPQRAADLAVVARASEQARQDRIAALTEAAQQAAETPQSDPYPESPDLG